MVDYLRAPSKISKKGEHLVLIQFESLTNELLSGKGLKSLVK